MPAATGLAGLAAGLMINAPGGSESDPGPAPAVVFSTEGSRSAPSVQVPVTIDDLRRVVREELAAQRTSTPPRAADHDPLAESTASSVAEQDAAARQARAVLDAAISRRSWTAADRDALHAQFPAMSPAQRQEWLQQYAQAVNQDRLVPDLEQPPF